MYYPSNFTSRKLFWGNALCICKDSYVRILTITFICRIENGEYSKSINGLNSLW